MKKLTIILIILLSEKAFCVIDTIHASSKISNVTIFFSGAQVTRTVDLNTTKGKYLIEINKLPHEINPQSIQISGIKNCKILSVKHLTINANENKKGLEEAVIQSKIETQEEKIKEIKNKQNVFDIEEKLLIDNSMLSKRDDGTTIARIKEAADFYRLRFNEIKQEKLLLDGELKNANKKIQEYYAQLNEVNSRKSKPYSKVLVTLDCEKNILGELKVSYFIPSAGWEPTYDFRVDEISKPFVIVYNANVYQSSGEDWDNIAIKLSTNNPTLSGDKPELITWILGRTNPYRFEPIRKGASALKGRIMDADKNEPIPFASVAVLSGGNLIAATSADIDGNYLIKPIPSGNYDIKASSIGYAPIQYSGVTFQADQVSFQNFTLKGGVIAMSEVQISSQQKTLTYEEIQRLPTRDVNSMAGQSAGVYKPNESEKLNIRGSRSDESAYDIDGSTINWEPPRIVDGIKVTNFISNSLKSGVTNLEYTIDIPYTIPSDGEDYNIKVKEVSVPVNYVYHAVPKLDNDAFLTAEIPGWNELNLMSGKSSVYFEGTFVGQSVIDVNQPSDTLNVSLGRDKDVFIKREENKEVNDKKILNSSVKEEIGFNITVRNNKDSKIKIVVEDQFPISERKSIGVERQESSNGKVDDKSGKLTWELQLDPNEKKIITYKYLVKYPRSTSLAMD